MWLFGKKVKPRHTGQDNSSKNNAGHQAVLRTLLDKEKTDPNARQQLVGGLICDMVCQLIKNDRGVRVEDLIAVLASVGGFSCIFSVLYILKHKGIPPQSVGVMSVAASDGHTYYIGEPLNQYLVSNPISLLGLTIGNAQKFGSQITNDFLLEVIKRSASELGSEAFGKPILPAENMPSDTLFNLVQMMWPRIREMLRIYDVMVGRFPEAMGFALAKAITLAKEAIDPSIAVRIAIECSVPMSKISPERVGVAI